MYVLSRLSPFDDDADVEVKLSKSKDMNVVLSNCNPVSFVAITIKMDAS